MIYVGSPDQVDSRRPVRMDQEIPLHVFLPALADKLGDGSRQERRDIVAGCLGRPVTEVLSTVQDLAAAILVTIESPELPLTSRVRICSGRGSRTLCIGQPGA